MAQVLKPCQAVKNQPEGKLSAALPGFASDLPRGSIYSAATYGTTPGAQKGQCAAELSPKSVLGSVVHMVVHTTILSFELILRREEMGSTENSPNLGEKLVLTLYVPEDCPSNNRWQTPLPVFPLPP